MPILKISKSLTKRCNLCDEPIKEDGITCSNSTCAGDFAPKGLGTPKATFIGRDPKIKVVRKFLPISASMTVDRKIEVLKRKLAKGQMADPGALLDDSMVVSTDATTRMKEMLQTDAQLKAQEQQAKPNQSQGSEEL
jgi:hypothetical protein